MSGATRHSVRTADITRLSHLQPRSKLDPATIKKYAQAYAAGGVLPPLTVARIGPRLVLVGGWHRLAALEMMGIRETDVVLIEAEEAELPWLAAKENMAHGLPLKNRDLVEAFKSYVGARQHVHPDGRLKSYREIGQEFGKPHTTIRNWMQKHFPRVFQQMAEDGEHLEGTTGGLRDSCDDRAKAAAARGQLNAVLAVAKEISDPQERGGLVSALERALQDLKDNWASCAVEFPVWEFDDAEF